MMVCRHAELQCLVIGCDIIVNDRNVYHCFFRSRLEGVALRQTEALRLLHAEVDRERIVADAVRHADGCFHRFALVILGFVEFYLEWQQFVVLYIKGCSDILRVSVGFVHGYGNLRVGVHHVVVGTNHVERRCRLTFADGNSSRNLSVFGQRRSYAECLVHTTVATALQSEAHRLAFLHAFVWSSKEQVLLKLGGSAACGVVSSVGVVLAATAVGLNHHSRRHFAFETDGLREVEGGAACDVAALKQRVTEVSIAYMHRFFGLVVHEIDAFGPTAARVGVANVAHFPSYCDRFAWHKRTFGDVDIGSSKVGSIFSLHRVAAVHVRIALDVVAFAVCDDNIRQIHGVLRARVQTCRHSHREVDDCAGVARQRTIAHIHDNHSIFMVAEISYRHRVLVYTRLAQRRRCS